MFVLLLKFVKSLDEVEKQLLSHREFLDKYYSMHKFICSGRRNSGTGGVIICTASNVEEVDTIIKEDPFYINEIAEYEIIEFSPTKYADGFDKYIK